MEDVSSLVRAKIPCVEPEDRVSRVALVLSRNRSNVVVVREGRRLVGCVMRRQLLRPPLAPETKAERLLSHPPVLTPSTPIRDAIALVIQSRCDMLPVVEGGLNPGAVIARDLAREMGDLDATLGDLPDRGIPSLTESSTISEAANGLRDHDLESLPVVDESGDLQGWVSFGDIHRYLLAPERGIRGTGDFVGERTRPLKNPIASLINRQGATAEPETGFGEAIEILMARKTNEITVVEANRFLSQVRVVDLLSLPVGERPGIPVQAAGLEREDPFEAGRVIENLKSTAGKIARICGRMQMPEIKVKTYEHRGSRRKRYEVRVTFYVPEQYVAEAKGWELLTVSQQALKKAEREILRGRSKVIDAHHRRRMRPSGEA